MLSWQKGPKACDGPWAQWWYMSVHKYSSWISEHQKKYKTVDPKLLPALRTNFVAYSFLKQLTHRHKVRGPAPEEIYKDRRNEDILVWIGAPGYGRLFPREFAGVNPWDSSVQGGDATWEGEENEVFGFNSTETASILFPTSS